MAKIIYGVQCTGHGHAMRALTVARNFPEHEFLFVSDGDGYELLRTQYPVVRCPNPESPVRRHQLKPIPALISNLKLHPRRRSHIRSILEVMDRFQPDAAITDFEHFVPLACRRAGLPCISLDHQHVVTCAVHDLPAVHQPGRILMSLAIKLLFDQAQAHVITSFFQPPLKPKAKAWLFPPLLRQIVLEKSARSGEHALAYYGYPTTKGFFSFLNTLKRTVLVYGSNVERAEGNLIFKKNSEEEFLKDLASCRYVVCGAGHTLISEALYYGKPLVVFPIRNAFEQFLNAHYVVKCGYGLANDAQKPKLDQASEFESRLEDFTSHISRAGFCGNKDIFAWLRRYFETKKLPAFSDPS